MIFKKLEITNYGIFKGKHEVSFAQPSIQRVTLVGGLNGSGKTTIFEAIQIALFGARSNLHKENKLLSYNKYLGSKINRDCNEGEGAEIRFTLNLADDIEIDDNESVSSNDLDVSDIDDLDLDLDFDSFEDDIDKNTESVDLNNISSSNNENEVKNNNEFSFLS